MSGGVDPELFAEPPARDARFEVKERWIECLNVPDEDPRRIPEFLHRQMNEEINGLEMACRGISDFPDAEWDLRMSMARQACDESRHIEMFRRVLEARGGHPGQYPVLNFQYRVVTRIPTLLGRLAVQNRSFEAGGLDGIAFGIEDARAKGNHDLAELFDAQLADEIGHVRYANEWIERCVKRDPRSVLVMAAALTAGTRGFLQVMGAEGIAGIKYSVDEQGRRDAGFRPEEIAAVAAMAAQRRASGGEPAI
jgi:uncharacterized ferritin-like protein (DUF455 family)